MSKNHLASAYSVELSRRIWIFEATKTMHLTCVECNFKVSFKNGQKKIPHFAHYPSKIPKTCFYFDTPSESQIHRDAKQCIKRILETSGTKIIFTYRCTECSEIFNGCEIKGSSNSNVECEVSARKLGYTNEGWVADVVRKDPFFIIEVKHTHSTRTPRPDPWVEIEATDLMSQMQDFKINKKVFHLKDISRVRLCISCEKQKKSQRLRELWQMLLLRKQAIRHAWYDLVQIIVHKQRQKHIRYQQLWKLLLMRKRRAKLNWQRTLEKMKQRQKLVHRENMRIAEMIQLDEEIKRRENPLYTCLNCKHEYPSSPFAPCLACKCTVYALKATSTQSAKFFYV